VIYLIDYEDKLIFLEIGFTFFIKLVYTLKQVVSLGSKEEVCD